jgi:hypothetical protein
MSKQVKLSPEAKVLLAALIKYGDCHVYADTIPRAAELINAGLAKAEDDYEGPQLVLTETGRKAAVIYLPFAH